jgi:large subunit ribosomal protein L10
MESLCLAPTPGKDFFQEGGEWTLAISEKRKKEVVGEYQDWFEKSKAVILTEYTGLSMKDMDALRTKVREAGGEFHVLKNTLAQKAFEGAGYQAPSDFFEGSTAAGFAFQDAPALAKTMTDFAKTAEFLKVKGGYLQNRPMSAAQVSALANLPPLPVMRAQLLGTILAPASQLARTLAEPARQIAAVLKGYADQDAAIEPVS